ncbi:MAG: hypothetical protein NTZ43_07340 [Gemmatimonadetes bacterium]|nr:hypothetical protein [Gemmatimonadota bacterium]
MADTQRIGTNKPGLKWGIAVVVLAAGYADLARGGVTLAPILLVIGYAVLIPVAIVS